MTSPSRRNSSLLPEMSQNPISATTTQFPTMNHLPMASQATISEMHPSMGDHMHRLTKEESRAIWGQYVSQIHFCRFVYKLAARIKELNDSEEREMVRPHLVKSFYSLIFYKLSEIEGLTLL